MSGTELRLVRLEDDGLALLEAALKAAALPWDDVREPGRLFYSSPVADPGFVGLEVHGRDSLLRSLVIPPELRGQGLGRRMVQALVGEAGRIGIDRLWLLTMTAERFFAGLGFAPVDRKSAPPSILATREFRDLCPSAATLMRRDLANRP